MNLSFMAKDRTKAAMCAFLTVLTLIVCFTFKGLGLKATEGAFGARPDRF